MNIGESIATAWESIRTNSLRALLTMLGIIIGVAAVIALLGIGNGFSDFIEAEISSVGTNLLLVSSNFDASDGYPTLTLGDVEALEAANLPDVAYVAGLVQASRSVTSGPENVRAAVTGVSADYFIISNIEELAVGRLFDRTDVAREETVVVLGYSRAEDLFPDNPSPVGETIRINGVRYTVIGVLAESGEAFNSTDNDIFIPLSVAVRRLASNQTRDGEIALNSILGQGASSERIDDAILQIANVLRAEHNLAYSATDDFNINSQSSLLETVGNLTGTLTLFLGAIAAISLLVGGIGIMNIMLVSVTERTREIGIRKAIGALRRDILVQFLIEALMISLVGGAIGVALGWTLAVVGGNFVDVAPVIDAQTIGLATGFSLLIGLVFGIYPAWRAAQLRPIDALRYE